MFKKIFYIISILLGIAVVLKVSQTKEYKDVLEVFKPIKREPEVKYVKK